MAVGRFKVETVATLTATYTAVTSVGAGDDPQRVIGWEVHNPSSAEDLWVRIDAGQPIVIPAVTTPPSVYASPVLGGGNFYKLGGTDAEVEWKAAANTITSPLFVWILAE